jgi:hypothetical protein
LVTTKISSEEVGSRGMNSRYERMVMASANNAGNVPVEEAKMSLSERKINYPGYRKASQRSFINASVIYNRENESN